jgi:hypothetical protein
MIRRRVSASIADNEMKSCIMVEICQPMTSGSIGFEDEFALMAKFSTV